jgi:hypothetical protein
VFLRYFPVLGSAALAQDRNGAVKYRMCRVFDRAYISGSTCGSDWIAIRFDEWPIEGVVKVSDQELPRWVTIKQAAEYYHHWKAKERLPAGQWLCYDPNCPKHRR